MSLKKNQTKIGLRLLLLTTLGTALPGQAQFYDAFNGTQLDYSRWYIAEKQWGGTNNGVVHQNVVVSNGVLHLYGNGNLYTGPIEGYDGTPGQQVGAAIATTNYYASGSYQVHMKLPAQTGGTSAIWPFHYEEAYPGDANYSTLADFGGLAFSNLTWIGLTATQATNLIADLTTTNSNGNRPPYLSPPTNGIYRTTSAFRGLGNASQMVLSNNYGLALQIFVVLANAASLDPQPGPYYIRNEEIDIETPTASSNSSSINFTHDRFNTWVGINNGEYTPNYDNVNYAFNDGQYHTFRFDWYTSTPTVLYQRVEFYIDGVCYQTNYTHVPTIGGRFWIGYWFSDWSGTPDFTTQELDVDWVQITPFNDSGDQSVPETYPNDGWWAGSMDGNPPPAITSISPTSGTAAGGATITITGTNFYTGTTVQFGSSAPIVAAFATNEVQLMVTNPPLSPGAVTVTVSNVDHQTATTTFTYVPQGSTTTTTTLTRDASTPSSTVTYGTATEFDVHVSPSAATGPVNLSDNGANIGSGTLSGGECAITPGGTVLQAGIHTNIVATYLGNSTYATSSSTPLPAQTVQPLALTVSSATANNKIYDGTTAATISGTLNGVLSGDTVTFIGTGVFANVGPGNNIPVTSTSTLGGASAANYTLIQPTGLSANITGNANSSIWIDTSSGGLWSGSNNWSGGNVPSGTNQMADFSELDLTSAITVHLDTPQTVGDILFGDTDSSVAAAWTLDNNSVAGNVLTLAAGTTPTITVNDPLNLGESATISAVIAGSNGLAKAGAGMLDLTGANQFTGGVTVANGKLVLANGSGDANASDVYILGSVIGGSAGLFCGNAGISNPIQLATNAAGTLSIGNDFSGSHPGFNGAIALNGQNLTIVAHSGGSGNTYLGGGVTGVGNLILTNGSASSTLLVNAPGLNNTGTITLAGTSTSGQFNLTGAIGTNVTALIYASASTPVVGSTAPTIDVNNLGTAIISTSPLTLPSTSGLTIGSTGSNLTLNANSTGNINIAAIGSGLGGSLVNSGVGTGIVTITAAIAAADNLSALVQNSATSPLILSNANTYTNSITVSNGMLLVNGSVGTAGKAAAPLTVGNGGWLGGIGTINRPVTIQSGGTLAPGTNGAVTGTLTIASNITLSGNLYFKLDKSLAQSNDMVKITGTAILTNAGSGTLIISNLGPALVVGDTFQLFSQPLLNGNALTISGPANFINNLSVNGSVTVTTGNPAPEISSVLPASGSTNGGTLVTINGANFRTGPTVTFGSVAASSITFVNSAQITARTPAHAAGAVTVKVTDTDSQSATAAYNYVPPPPPATAVVSVIGKTNLSLVWQGGANQNCVLLETTNIALPLAEWTVIATNAVGSNGFSTNIIPMTQGPSPCFYLLGIPYN